MLGLKLKFQKIDERKCWFFDKINKIEKPLSRLKRKKKMLMNKIRNERQEVITDILEIQRTLRLL